MPDFTLNIYKNLLESLLQSGYHFQPFAEFLEAPAEKTVILRHDIDARPRNSLDTAVMEHDLEIRGTYYFRIVPQSNRPDVIRKIAELGHEIGYHYEDLALSKGNMAEAMESFEKNLSYFRQFGPVTTVCMHGSPMSRYDNRKLWEHYDYRKFGVTGEPYFDIDFSCVLYLTDTGRRWDGEKVSVRDRVPVNPRNHNARATSEEQQRTSPPLHLRHSFHSTFDIIRGAENGSLPLRLLITLHPQRWTNNLVLWTKELVWQNTKNMVKRAVVGEA